MSWMADLVRVYDENKDQIGRLEYRGHSDTPITPLLPIGHGTMRVNVEVELSPQGDFRSARVLSRAESSSIVPMTETSSARTSSPVPHPLVDKLQYLAPDYASCGGKGKTLCADPDDPSGKRKATTYDCYITGLNRWADSEEGTDKVRAVRAYLKKGTLISDLIKAHVLIEGKDGKLADKHDAELSATERGDSIPAIFPSLVSGDQADSVVRFSVDGVDLSRDMETWDSWSSYAIHHLSTEGISYLSGEKVKVSSSNPAKIRNQGDGAKLISSNDSVNYTYRGRFSDPSQVYAVGYEETQKAHNALRWLIARQGTSFDSMAFVAWGKHALPEVCADSVDLIGEDTDDIDTGDLKTSGCLREEYSRKLGKRIMGYRTSLGDSTNVYAMMLDAATPGRLSIRYYRELSFSRFLRNIELWHKRYSWLFANRMIRISPSHEGEKPVYKFITYWGAPSPKDIAEAIHGTKAPANVQNATIVRIIPCIIGGSKVPQDLVNAAVNAFPHAGYGMKRKEGLIYRRKVLETACALIHGKYCQDGRESAEMIDENQNDRSYLFGRILACAEQVERSALAVQNAGKEKGDSDSRLTNAEQLLPAFIQKPVKTLAVLQTKLVPYLARLRANGRSAARYDLMLELISRIGEKDFTNKELGELYLLGYAQQKMVFRDQNAEYRKKHQEQGTAAETNEDIEEV